MADLGWSWLAAPYVVCTALMLLRAGAYLCTSEVAAGGWPQARVRNGHEVDGKTMGIVGLGAIGQLVARLSSCMGMRVIAWAPWPKLRRIIDIIGG